jgi:alanine racemase
LKSWIEISSAALAANVQAVRDVVGEDVSVLAVVKADGYGHGAEGVASVLADADVEWLGVSDVEEGARVRQQLGSRAMRILVMVGMEAQDAAEILEHKLTPVVWTREQVHALEQAARAVGQRIAIHLEIETGMARQGAAVGAELADALDALAQSPWVVCEGVMTHLCSSEIAGSPVTAKQIARFSEALGQVTAAGIQPHWLHLGNSSAVDEGGTMAWIKSAAAKLGARAMVRPGLAIYGHCLPVEAAAGSAAAAHLVAQLEPVMTWKARVIGVREIAAGATVGYGATFVAETPMRLALLPVGYADGFRRAASSGVGNGWVMLQGRRAAVVGRVSMNLTVVDVSEFADVSVGDEAVLLGDGVSAEDHARWANTIPYDILCGVRGTIEVR